MFHKMFHKHSVSVCILLVLMAVLATPAGAQTLAFANASASCQNFYFDVQATGLTLYQQYTVAYVYTVTCNGVPTTVPESLSFTNYNGSNNNFTETISSGFIPWSSQLAGSCTVSVVAT